MSAGALPVDKQIEISLAAYYLEKQESARQWLVSELGLRSLGHLARLGSPAALDLAEQLLTGAKVIFDYAPKEDVEERELSREILHKIPPYLLLMPDEFQGDVLGPNHPLILQIISNILLQGRYRDQAGRSVRLLETGLALHNFRIGLIDSFEPEFSKTLMGEFILARKGHPLRTVAVTDPSSDIVKALSVYDCGDLLSQVLAHNPDIPPDSVE